MSRSSFTPEKGKCSASASAKTIKSKKTLDKQLVTVYNDHINKNDNEIIILFADHFSFDFFNSGKSAARFSTNKLCYLF